MADRTSPAGDWRSQLGDRLIDADQAASLVQSGQTVAFTMGREAHAFGFALSARLGELTDVHVFTNTPGYDFGWYDEGWQDSFEITVGFPTATVQDALDAHRVDFWAGVMYNDSRPTLWKKKPNILITEISSPDERGFCSFGQSLWNKRKQILNARPNGILVIAEVNENLIRTYGENFINVSDIDYFVEHVQSGAEQGSGSLAGRAHKEPEPYLKDIARNVAQIIRDGDCLQIGVGRTTEPLVRLGAFAGKNDLGYHSEATPPGIISLVRDGVINGRRKSVRPGKAVVTSLGGGTKAEMEWANFNPAFELVDFDYLEDPRIIASNDNVVAINNALAIDLGGQITAESLGARVLSAPGGQPSFVMGAILSKGGRSIHVLPSTAQDRTSPSADGRVSRIMPELPAGTVVTVPRHSTDYVVTEYGIASLWGKTLRQRAEELIAIAHPAFRDRLWTEAKARLWP